MHGLLPGTVKGAGWLSACDFQRCLAFMHYRISLRYEALLSSTFLCTCQSHVPRPRGKTPLPLAPPMRSTRPKHPSRPCCHGGRHCTSSLPANTNMYCTLPPASCWTNRAQSYPATPPSWHPTHIRRPGLHLRSAAWVRVKRKETVAGVREARKRWCLHAKRKRVDQLK